MQSHVSKRERRGAYSPGVRKRVRQKKGREGREDGGCTHSPLYLKAIEPEQYELNTP